MKNTVNFSNFYTCRGQLYLSNKLMYIFSAGMITEDHGINCVIGFNDTVIYINIKYVATLTQYSHDEPLITDLFQNKGIPASQKVHK